MDPEPVDPFKNPSQPPNQKKRKGRPRGVRKTVSVFKAEGGGIERFSRQELLPETVVNQPAYVSSGVNVEVGAQAEAPCQADADPQNNLADRFGFLESNAAVVRLAPLLVSMA